MWAECIDDMHTNRSGAQQGKMKLSTSTEMHKELYVSTGHCASLEVETVGKVHPCCGHEGCEWGCTNTI